MKELMNIAMTLKVMESENALFSKVDGRRNWVIRVENRGDDRIISYRGAYGFACDRGFMECSLMGLGNKNVRWYTFTYKKDYKETVKKLISFGVKDRWDELHGID